MSLDCSSAKADKFPIPDVIPIFPLPTVVFFPETYLPLHIFEPRYKEMVQDISTQGQCIGMALLKDGGEEQNSEAPPIHLLGCVGRIISSHGLSDGRFNIVLQGLHRCLYEEEVVSTPYRQARILRCSHKDPFSLDFETRNQLEQVTQEYLSWKKAHELSQVIASGKLTDSILVHNLSAGLDLSPVEKQFLLESDHLTQQARRLIDLIRFKLPDSYMAQG